MGGFLCGLVLASLYGAAALLLQGGPLWFCVYSTAAVALLASFSMGLSASARANVMLMLPTLLSGQGLFISSTVTSTTSTTNPTTANTNYYSNDNIVLYK